MARKTWPERTSLVDGYLDDLYDVTHRATEWDADQWGFDTSRWMADERSMMDMRAGGVGFWPTEVSKHELEGHHRAGASAGTTA